MQAVANKLSCKTALKRCTKIEILWYRKLVTRASSFQSFFFQDHRGDDDVVRYYYYCYCYCYYYTIWKIVTEQSDYSHLPSKDLQ